MNGKIWLASIVLVVAGCASPTPSMPTPSDRPTATPLVIPSPAPITFPPTSARIVLDSQLNWSTAGTTVSFTLTLSNRGETGGHMNISLEQAPGAVLIGCLPKCAVHTQVATLSDIAGGGSTSYIVQVRFAKAGSHPFTLNLLDTADRSAARIDGIAYT